MDQLSHILHRPDMYIGSIKPTTETMYVATMETYPPSEEEESSKATGTFRIINKEIKYNPGLLRIFIEVLSNCIDNKWRSEEHDIKMTKIDVSIDMDSGETTVKNDGLSIPIVKHETGEYTPKLIFGKLLTSSNYDDTKERKTSGKNGIGCKVTNIFSKVFTVKIVDPPNESTYEQTWTNNMGSCDKEKIKKSKLKTGSTEISYIPDFVRFGVNGYSQDMMDLMLKLCIDTAMITGLNVTFNKIKIPVKNMLQYAKLYDNESEMISFDTTDSNVVILGKYIGKPISFVNGIYTTEGGIHVDTFADNIYKTLLDKINKKDATLTVRDMKNHFTIFVNSTLDKPCFTSQEKTKLVSPEPAKFDIPPRIFTNIMKWPVIEDIRDTMKKKELGTLKKVEKKRGFKKIEGLDPANNAGTKKSKDCGLILCEGLSAKTYAVMGIEVGAFGKKGRDWWGILPLRGKVLNTRNASVQTLSKNKEIVDLIQTLNIKANVDYTDDKNFESLDYGFVMILTDQDVDGNHIASLIMNFFHSIFPTVLKRKEPFLRIMHTPLIRVFLKSKTLSFYSQQEYKMYEQKNSIKGSRIKYYKGLGTSNNQEIRESFGKKIALIEYCKDTDDTMDHLFSSKHADYRKSWLEQYDPSMEEFVPETPTYNRKIADYLNKELIKFSIDDCKRSIPHMIDGLKESQRKILYAMFLKNLSYTSQTIKVAQLAGFVSEKTNYHHGEQCLYDTITKMASDMVGVNNVPLLFRDGQFGSRLEGGKDAASARYIFTKFDQLTQLLFRKEDEDILTYIVEEGDSIEPEYYVPILPTILMNGVSAGIGTGWSCNIPCFHPMHVAKAVKEWIKGGKESITDIQPWYRDFMGSIEKVGDTKYQTNGLYEETDSTVIVSELPVGMWTDKFKDMVEDMVEQKRLKSYKNYSTPYTVHFELEKQKEENIDDFLDTKLKTTLSTNNIVVFNAHGKLQKIDTVQTLIDEFCKVRYSLYEKRIVYMLGCLRKQHTIANARLQFIREIIEKTIVLFEKEEDVIYKILETKKYPKDEKDSYGYLLDMNIRTFTKKRMEELEKEITRLKKEIEELEHTTVENIWTKEIDMFVSSYEEWIHGRSQKEEIEEEKPKPKTKKVAKKK
jgi:DNA topoisomerase-2